MIKAGIIGGAGYTAGELIRILVNHPEVQISFVHSESNAGNPICSVHEGLIGDTDLTFCSGFDLKDIDVLFLCGAHGKSGDFWEEHEAPSGLKIIDLAQDFRDESEGYIYGLPEWQKDRIAGASKVANPGCFATAIQLALLPLASKGLLKDSIEITAITGSTGAGVKPGPTSHFSWRNNNISTYKVFTHQHLIEIRRNLSIISSSMASGQDCTPVGCATLGNIRGGTACGGAERSEAPVGAQSCTGAVPEINFVPVRGDFARGIFASVYTDCPLSQEEASALYKDFYNDAAFTFVSDLPADLKQVVNTNKCIIALEKHDNKLVISSAIDNLLKGASGQAVQNMNIMFGLDEKTGLKLKASAF